MLTVVFGLFHGLLLLPVLLSLAGPAGEENDDADAASSDNNDVTTAGDDNRAFQSEVRTGQDRTGIVKLNISPTGSHQAW